VAIFERITPRPGHVTLHGLTTSLPKQTDLLNGCWNEQTCQPELLPPSALANILNRWIRWHLHLAVFVRDREAEGREQCHMARALLRGGES
jgi:hypothetical protein